MSETSATGSRIMDCIKVWPQYLIPQHSLSKLMYWLTRIQFKPWKNLLINQVVRLYNVELNQAERESADDYISFNDFFTRHLKQSARTWNLNKSSILSPVDGAISQIGKLDNNNIIQAKGKTYTLDTLLANDTDTIAKLSDGFFTTLYLSPRDYHRIHMPVRGKLIKSIYVPGNLFAVNNATVRNVDNLFARNERFISIFETDLGLMAQIMVGAIFVGSMETVWLGQITPPYTRQLDIREYKDNPVILEQGQEFGHFNMGSTVILVFEKECLSWLTDLKASDAIEVGQELGKVNN
ncbi:MAG: phosphatidylserine decarboxylase [Gammaproteobacteria bacterium]|jgi:phosphatidylserine decarboxylase